MDYILDSLLGLRHSAGVAVPSVRKNEWILLIWRGRHSQSHKREETDCDRWCHAKNINTAIWCLIRPSLPLTLLPSLASSLDPSGPFKHKVMLLACVGNLPPDPEGTSRGPAPGWQEAWPCCTICVSHTHARHSCDIVCVSSLLWRVRGQIDRSGVKETTFIWNTIFSVWTDVTSSFLSLRKTLGATLNVYFDGKIIFQYMIPSREHAMTRRGWIKLIYLTRYSCPRARGSFACCLVWTLNQPRSVLNHQTISK